MIALMDPLSTNMDKVVLMTQCIALYCLGASLYKLFKRHFVETALDYIPGPPSQSVITGMFTY